MKVLYLEQLQSEANLWKILEESTDQTSSPPLWGLLMSYVDDILVVSHPDALPLAMQQVRSQWKTTEPELVSQKPITFLGMEVPKSTTSEGLDEWFITQESYIKDLLANNEDRKIHPRKIPITRAQSQAEQPEEGRTPESVRLAQI